MFRLVRPILAVVLAAAVLAAGARSINAVVFAGLSLKMSRETAAPGAMAQMKLFVTEPKPISSAGGFMSFAGFDEFAGIAVTSPANDTVGIAVVRSTTIALQLVSSTASFGSASDYPVLTFVGHVPASAVIGAIYPITIDPSLIRFLDPAGARYPIEVREGSLTVAPSVSIHDVNPGSALVPAGGTVTLTGNGFTPETEIRFKDGKLSQVRYVGPDRIDVTLARPLTMHGVQIQARNADGSRAVYYSYQRTHADSPSSDPIMSLVVPILLPIEVQSATVSIPQQVPQTTYGVAVQNIQSVSAAVTIDLFDGFDNPIGTTTVGVGARRYVVRDLFELFGFVPVGPARLRVQSSTPVQVVGVAADQTTGMAAPIQAR